MMVIVTTTLYEKIDIIDHNFSFLWMTLSLAIPQGLHPYYNTCATRAEVLQIAQLVP